ncbi:unnamed protein product [Malus baccata var. baccata]
MDYDRSVSICDSMASDLAGEIIAALSVEIVSGLIRLYSEELATAAKKLYESALLNWTLLGKQHTPTLMLVEENLGISTTRLVSKMNLVWGGTWLFFATGYN